MEAAAASPLLWPVGWSVVLLFLHVMLQGVTATRELGSAWNAGPRDDGRKVMSVIAGRAERASANFRETYPAFIALALALAIAGKGTGLGLTGAWLWLGFRIVYIPLYLAGIAYVRSFAWLGAGIGLAMMFVALVF